MVKNLIRNLIYPLFKSRPDFLIIGAQKAGTTSLYNYLVQHPQVIGNKSWKEIRYFDLQENYNQGFGWYLGQFPSKLEKGNRLTFDASPSYLYFPHIPELIKKELGEIKMIAILRNPVNRAYSAWKMYHSFGTNPNVGENNKKIADTRSFSEAIDQELNNRCSPDIYYYDYINRGKYVEQLENYYKYFPRETILVLNFEQLKDDLQLVLNQICDFLEIQRFSQEVIGQFKEKKYNVGLKSEKSPVDQEVMERLKDYFQPYNQRTYELLGHNYNW